MCERGSAYIYAASTAARSKGRARQQNTRTRRGGLYFRRQRFIALDECLCLFLERFDLVVGKRIDIVLIRDEERGLSWKAYF
jgi:hypothetical protein